MRRGISSFVLAFSRTKRRIPQNFDLFLGPYMRLYINVQFCFICQPFRGQEEPLETLCQQTFQNALNIFNLASANEYRCSTFQRWLEEVLILLQPHMSAIITRKYNKCKVLRLCRHTLVRSWKNIKTLRRLPSCLRPNVGL